MHVDQALIEAMEKIRDAMLDFEVAADQSGMTKEAPKESAEPAPEPQQMHDEPDADETGGPPDDDIDDVDDKSKFTSLGNFRFGGGSPKVQSVEVDVKPNKSPVGKRRY